MLHLTQLLAYTLPSSLAGELWISEMGKALITSTIPDSSCISKFFSINRVSHKTKGLYTPIPNFDGFKKSVKTMLFTQQYEC